MHMLMERMDYVHECTQVQNKTTVIFKSRMILKYSCIVGLVSIRVLKQDLQPLYFNDIFS